MCENNLYMEYTAIGDVTAVEHPAADRASAYGLEPILVDGNDPDEVHATARRAVDRARAGEGPSLVEAVTYRHGGHSRADPGKYRPDDEVAEWLGRDPDPDVPRASGRRGRGGRCRSTRSTPRSWRPSTARPRRRRPGPLPDAASLDTQLWADGGSAWRS